MNIFEIYLQYKTKGSDDIVICYGKNITSAIEKITFVKRMVSILDTTPICGTHHDRVFGNNKSYAVKIITNVKDTANRNLPLIIIFSEDALAQYGDDALLEQLNKEKAELEIIINLKLDIEKKFRALISDLRNKAKRKAYLIWGLLAAGLIILIVVILSLTFKLF